MTSDPSNYVQTTILENPWRNAYWFARMLINNDKYGALGKRNKLMLEISSSIRTVLEDKNQSEGLKVHVSKQLISNIISNEFKRKTGQSDRVNLFVHDLFEKIQSTEDLGVFVLTIENIVIPINKSLEIIPNDDKQYTESIARTYLDTLGDDALATVIRIWDDAGTEGCLNAERTEVVREFTQLTHILPNLPEYETNLILTAFIQEFERRLGQKRKSRAGGSLEDVADFLFDYYGIKAERAPEHFQSDIEIDKWVKCKDKWLIGISCKRTLRERWKQVSSASDNVLSRHKIRYVWHLITYDEDLSDDKLSALGSQRHIFYLRDDSRRLGEFKNKIGLKDYVRPMSSFIDDLKQEMNEQIK